MRGDGLADVVPPPQRRSLRQWTQTPAWVVSNWPWAQSEWPPMRGASPLPLPLMSHQLMTKRKSLQKLTGRIRSWTESGKTTYSLRFRTSDLPCLPPTTLQGPVIGRAQIYINKILFRAKGKR